VSFFFIEVFVPTCFRYSYYRTDEAVGAGKRLLPRAIEKWWQAVARGWAVLLPSRVAPAGTRTATLFGGITAQHRGGRVRAFRCKNRDSGGLVGRSQLEGL